MRTAIQSLKIIKEMYEYFVKKYRDLEPNLMICEKEDFDNIEKTLKNYEELTSKPVILCRKTHKSAQALIDTICKNYKEVKVTNLEDEKQLKTLEIIKEKEVNVGNLLSYCFETNDTYEEYVKSFEYADNYWELGKELLTQEEYDLLKEVLL